jgi:imidazolonepropionase-like amidohydrolase
MVKAGLSPAQALQTATINPARYFNMENRTGSIAANKIANLVLLDGNPLVDISNTKKIATVILHGKVFNEADLRIMLEKAKTLAGN